MGKTLASRKKSADSCLPTGCKNMLNKETFYPLPIPYHPHPLFFTKEPHPLVFTKEPHPLFLFEIGVIHCIRVLRRRGRME